LSDGLCVGPKHLLEDDVKLARCISRSMDGIDAEATDFKKCDIWTVPRRKWNSSVHTVPRHAMSAINAVPGDVRVPMDSYSTSITLARGFLVWHNGL
jgi:hypothetical protein